MELALVSMGVSAGTAATISTVVGAIGTALSVGSVLAGGAADQADYSASIAAANANAKIARENAALTETQTASEVARATRERQIRTGSARAAAGSSGGGLTGSALDVLADNTTQEELNILSIKHEGLLKQRAYLQNAGLEEASAAATGKQKKMGVGTTWLSAGGALMAPRTVLG